MESQFQNDTVETIIEELEALTPDEYNAIAWYIQHRNMLLSAFGSAHEVNNSTWFNNKDDNEHIIYCALKAFSKVFRFRF